MFFVIRWAFRLALAGLLAVGLGYLPYQVYGPAGVGRARRLQRELADLATGNLKLQLDNKSLRMQIERLKHDRRVIEKVARDEFGLVRPSDLVFQFQQSGGR